MLLSLHSILLQRNVSLQIVLSDDGSLENQIPEAVTYLERNGFYDYEILVRKENGGIVASTYEALPLCRGKYIKMLSPGDYLYGNNTLEEWISYMEKNRLSVSYSDAIYYHWKDGRITPEKVKLNPQRTGGGIAGRIHQLVYDDIWLGAATLVDACLMQAYIAKLYSHVTYAEDHVYRLMTYAGERFGYFPARTVLYEYGSGISTVKEDTWKKRLKKDWEEADNILKTQECDHAWLEKLVKKRIMINGCTSRFYRLVNTCIFLPGYIIYRLNVKFHPRYSYGVLDKKFVDELVSDVFI